MTEMSRIECEGLQIFFFFFFFFFFGGGGGGGADCFIFGDLYTYKICNQGVVLTFCVGMLPRYVIRGLY